MDDDARDAIKAAYHALKAQGYQTAPLVNGNKHSLLKWDNVRDSDFDVDELTGIRLRLGEQADKTYLCVYDYDKLSDEYGQQLEEYLSTMPDCYSERSVSGGFHVVFKTDSNPDVHGSRMLPKIDDSTARHGYLELLYTNQQAVNIAPTVSFVNKWDFPGEPVYGASHVIAGDILNLPKIPVNEVREYITAFESKRRPKASGTQNNIALKSKEIELATAHVHEYAYLSDINRAIKLAFSMPDTLLNFLNVSDSIVCDDKGYIRFSSLLADDGNNPDALLYLNNDQKNKNLWSGYSVQDFHYDGDVMSFAVYLALADIDLFKKLMSKLGFDGGTNESPIQVEYTGEKVVIECERYPDPDEVLQIIKNVNPEGKQRKIVITAPTGTGKTEMFYRLAASKKLKLIIALSYTSQVLQAKAKYTIDGIMGGMCDEDHVIPKGSIFMTYDKAQILENSIDPKNYVLVIDEYHNIVNHSNFRTVAIEKLKNLAQVCPTVIYMTATPEYINYKDVDLVIQIKPKNITVKPAYVINYDRDKLQKIANLIVSNHEPNTISVVYVRDISMIEKIEKVIKRKYPQLEMHIVHAGVKDESKVYQNIAQHEILTGQSVYKNGGIMLTTNLLVDGVNINNENINCLYLLDIRSTTDLIQYPSRFRKGYNNYYIITSGKTPEYAVPNRTRQEWVRIHYNLALLHKVTYNNINRLLNSSIYNVIDKDIKKIKNIIRLPECFQFLDSSGNIDESLILRKVQENEAIRMNWCFDTIRKYMSNDEYNYNFDLTNSNEVLTVKTSFTPQDVDLALKKYKSDTDKAVDQVKTILTNKKYIPIRNEMILDYLKTNNNEFEELSKITKISKHKSTKKYLRYTTDTQCKKVLWRYCTGLELGMSNPELLLDDKLKRNNIRIMRDTVFNLRAEAAGVDLARDNRFLRYHTLRILIRELKNNNNSDTTDLSVDELKHYAKRINDKTGKVYNPNNVTPIVNELKTIFKVENKMVKDNNAKTVYEIGDEWSLDNVMGINFLV